MADQHVCVDCGQTFDPPGGRGRPPSRCESCREGRGPKSGACAHCGSEIKPVKGRGRGRPNAYCSVDCRRQAQWERARVRGHGEETPDDVDSIIDIRRAQKSEPREPSAAAIGDVKPPWGLTEGAERVWMDLAPDLVRKKILTAADVHLFSVYCEAAAMYKECRDLLGDRYIGKGAAGGDIVSPYFQAMVKCQQQMVQIGARMGLTPADRARLASADEPDASGLDELIS
ncbi:phage terminase small subunit P27 family [Gordonia oryzae]|uniref:Phage terminase small subunit P27 family n=1 Tax=Gordonia oryzae TaxID=2487349 RepID=A0A3N4H4Q1_9ACTN|nr:phage terminase small subunit P27 family [Gordonia oryzae]